MSKRKIIKNFTCSLVGISTLLPTSFISSCSLDNMLYYNVNGSNWPGRIAGKFENDSYIVDETNKTITYTNSFGMHFKNLVIPNKVLYKNKLFKVYLGDNCFSENDGLTGTIELNDYIDTIPNACFRACHNLKSIVFHRYPKVIGNFAVSETAVEHIFVKQNNEYDEYWSIELIYIGDSAFRDSWLSGELIFSKSLEYIGKSAFMGCINLIGFHLEFSKNIQIIPDEAFSGCTSLKEAYFSPSIKMVGRSAFFFCQELRKVNLPVDNMSITFEDDAFASCLQLNEFSRPLTIDKIGERAFAQDNHLFASFLDTSYKVKLIKKDAFASCDFASLAFHQNIEEVGDFAFSDCRSLCCLDFSDFKINPPAWTGKQIFLSACNKGIIYLAPETSLTTQWLDFFTNNSLVIGRENWLVVKRG